jgi:hypothetical protein
MSTDPNAPPPSRRCPAPDTIDDATSELIRGKARQLAHRIRLPRTDLADLEQDLALHVWSRLGHYDPERQPDRAAFIRMLVGHAAASVLRGRVRRTRHAPESLDALLRAALAPHGPDEPADRRAWPHPERAHVLALDVAAVLATLPRPLRRVAEALRTHSVAAAARRLRISRAAVYRHLAEVREAFVAAGLGEFSPGADTSNAAGVVPGGGPFPREDERCPATCTSSCSAT